MTDATRLNKYLSECGHCSRRAADRLIAQGRVTIDGVTAVMGSKVPPGAEVVVDGTVIRPQTEAFVYLALHKPVGIVCTTDTRREKNNIIDFIDYPKRVFPIGRLDKASEGLIFLTNDGDIVNQILRARNHHEKEYIVAVHQRIRPEFLASMRAGVDILDTTTRPCVVEQLGAKAFRIILTQGLNRQIRRMCKALGYSVARLQRVRIMNVHLDLEPGALRDLTSEELSELRRLVSTSSKTAD